MEIQMEIIYMFISKKEWQELNQDISVMEKKMETYKSMVDSLCKKIENLETDIDKLVENNK